ncbi:lipopolysaccharide biosynthesis protein [Treponema brennaborense]|nr:MATE family efflux transporter [Treponema brennaborense]
MKNKECLVKTSAESNVAEKSCFHSDTVTDSVVLSAYTTSSKRIARNTLMLYFRQILIMLVSLYTVRVILHTLGAEDYGIYNVVAGVVVLFSFVNNAMATGTQRFLNFELGRKNAEAAKKVYSISLLIHTGISVVFIILAETAGLWFVSSKLNIPAVRRDAAVWVYQFTVLTTVVNIFRVPYHAVIIAYEKMSFFAKISILEAFLKLGIVFLLTVSHSDKLISYSLLLCGVSFIILIVYKIYCNKHFEIAHFAVPKEKGVAGELVSFSGWSLLGAVANVSNSQGTNIVLNMFTNVTVNAAMGIANQVNSAVYSFVVNFQTAFNPQIVKSYAAGEREKFNSFVFRTSKISFLLLWMIVLPLSLNLEGILTVWLKNVPVYSMGFVQLILIYSLIDALNGSLWVAVQARGKIKTYQIIVSILIFANLPASIIAFRFGASTYSILIIRIFLAVIVTIFRILYLKKNMSFKAFSFLRDVIFRCVCIALLSFFIVRVCVSGLDGPSYFFISCLLSVVFCGVFSFFIGLKKEERKVVLRFLKTKLGRKR